MRRTEKAADRPRRSWKERLEKFLSRIPRIRVPFRKSGAPASPAPTPPLHATPPRLYPGAAGRAPAPPARGSPAQRPEVPATPSRAPEPVPVLVLAGGEVEAALEAESAPAPEPERPRPVGGEASGTPVVRTEDAAGHPAQPAVHPIHPAVHPIHPAVHPIHPAPGPAPARPRRGGEDFVPFSDSRITLVALDPYRAVAFWDAVPRAIEAARRRLEDPGSPPSSPGARLAVCFHEISLVDFDGSNANETIRVDAPSPAGNYYLSLWSPGKCFVADLVVEAGSSHPGSPHDSARGARTALLARSNFIELPRDGESHRYEDRRRRVRGAGSPLWRQRGVPETIGSVMGHVAEAALASEDDDLEEAAAPLPRELVEMEGASAPEPAGPLAAAAAADPAGAVHARAELAEEAVAAMADPTATAEATGARVREAAVRLEAGGPSSWVHALPEPRPEPAPPGISSLERPAAIQDEPYLEVKADLVIYGRTRPGTDVVIDGVHVPVRPDGTFDLRFSLPPTVPRSCPGVERPAATSGRARKLRDPARKLARKRPAREEP